MSASTPKKYTLEDIDLRKKIVLDEIQFQKKAMTTAAREIFAPVAPAATKADALMRSFNTGMAVFDGVMIGVKMIRKIRSYFRKLK